MPATSKKQSVYKNNGLDLARIHPNNHPKFSPNLHAFLSSSKGKHIARLGTVFRDEQGTLWLGYKDDLGSLIGARLPQVLCFGKKAEVFSYSGLRFKEVENFWENYCQTGRCAIDPQHKEYFVGDASRWDVRGNTRSCMWCGKGQQVLKRWTETATVEKSTWLNDSQEEVQRISVSV